MKILLGNKAEKAEAGSIDGDDDDDEEEEEQDGLKAFEEVEGDCKLVLIVRTDLGMNKGSSPCSPSFPHPSQTKNPPPLPQAKSPLKPPTPHCTTTKSSPHTNTSARYYGGGNPQGKRKSLCRPNQKSSLRNCMLKR